MAYSMCPMLTQSAPSLAAFRAAWFTTVLMSAPKTSSKMEHYETNQTIPQKLILNAPKTDGPSEVISITSQKQIIIQIFPFLPS